MTELTFAYRISANTPKMYFTALYNTSGKYPWQFKAILQWLLVYRSFATVRTVCQTLRFPLKGKYVHVEAV
jgi:hypothetical protein